MNRQRFNTLLKDPSLVDNNDIRQLNEYRKKYPYFQSLYVVVAKALKDREHPKTDAFIKKAAIFSANRAHLKEIIESDTYFVPVPVAEVIQEELVQTKEEKATKTEDAKPKTSEVAQPIIVNPEIEEEPKSKKTLDEQLAYNPNLQALEDTKSRIEALLRGEVPEEDPKEHDRDIEKIQAKIDSKLAKDEPKPRVKSTKKNKKNNQIEIIEKFIADDPRIDIRNKAMSEGEQDQVDLAEKSLKKPDSFITETMAKLMVKQGKVKRALDIYQKLSLKFPEKSAYFASQIEKVKSKHNV